MKDDFDRTLDLIHRAQAGDAVALNAIFVRYGDRVRGIVRLRLGAALRGRLDSGDIVQETFAAAVRDFGSFVPKDEASLMNWLSQIALNRIRDQAGHHGADKRTPEREVPLPSATTTGAAGVDPPASGPTPAEQAARAEEIGAVEICLSELPAEQRELIIQREYLGREWNEVATHTGHPSGAAARMAHSKVIVELGACIRRRRSGG